MHIDFECSGGFANVLLTFRGDTDELPQDLAKELLRLVKDSGFFDLRESDVAPRSPGPPDAFLYRLSLSEGERKKSLTFSDVTAPPHLHPLLAFLRQRAMDQRTKRQ